MRANSLLGVLLVLLCAASRGVAQGSPTPDSAEKAASDIRAVSMTPMTLLNDPTSKSLSPQRRDSFFAASAELTLALGEKFLRDFPQDQRRWEVIQSMLFVRPIFSGADADARKAQWQQRRDELVALVLADPSAPCEIVGSVAGGEVMSALRESQPANHERARAAVKVLRERAAELPIRAMLEGFYLEGLAANDPSGALTEARQLAADRNSEVADAARLWIVSVEFKTKPLDLKFPDIDGREIDLARYRGKVVLLDFWSTWCVPCMEQMPHLREIYGKYHAQGFEVIGIADEIPVRDPANPRPVEKTVPTLKEFLAKHDMPWPQLWDTRTKKLPGPKGLLQQFGVRSLPTYLLFDKNGMFVTSELQGPKLEAEVRRLLDL